MNVVAWLQDLGLQRYAQAFRDNDIDADVLPKLTVDDLIAIGVTSVGHRRKLLDAIASLGAETATPVAEAQSPGPQAPQADAERRQLSVMFCDLVGSTALSTRYDPEDLRELIRDYHGAVVAMVSRFDGFVAQYMGDGALIYYGYPQAHEDDAERAVHAGLAVIEAVGQLPGRQDLRVRVGIATGLVVVGEVIGEGSSQQRGVLGETPNLAARLQALAAPDSLVIAESTRRQIGELFNLEDLGAQQLKGFVEPQRVWRVLGESGEVSRFDALRSGDTPLVGRDEEIELLRRRWAQARGGEGRVVLISGEPGIGKSRLTAALAAHIETEPHMRLRYFCSPHHQSSALYPVIAQLERAAGFARDDTSSIRLDKLRALLAPSLRDDEDFALLSELLLLPSPASDLNLSPQRKREKLFEALLHQLEAEARDRPVLMVFEDVQWIDPTSRELLDLSVDRVRHLPVLLAITFRPEFRSPWGGRPYVTNFGLRRLGEPDGKALVLKLAGGAALDTDIISEIVERTDGVPLFVEELTKAVLESAAQSDQVSAVLGAASLAAQSVPATLHASLMARLDRLGPVPKEIAQIGALLGREFSYELIEIVAQRPAKQVQAALGQLTEAGLLFCRGTAPYASYLFKHALVQDAAYGTLLRGRRQELHGRVAAVLETHFADLVERQPELLAHHLTAARDTERAAHHWLKAGRHAAARSAHFESISHLEQGLSLLPLFQSGADRDGCEIDLQLALAGSLLTAKGADAAKPSYTRAFDLADSSGSPQQRFEALYGIWQATNMSGGSAAASPLSAKLLSMTEQEADDGLRLQAHHSAWATWAFAGDPAKTRSHTDAGRRLYDPEEHASHRFVYGGHDPGACACLLGAQAEWLLGYPETALKSVEESLSLAKQIAHPFTLSLAMTFAAVLHLNRGDLGSALSLTEAVEILVREQRLSLPFEPEIVHGAALAGLGDGEDAVARLRRGAMKSPRLGRPYGFALLGHSLARRGNHDAGLAALQEGLEIARETGEHGWDAELHRLRGTALLAENKLPEGEDSLRQAIQIAQVQRARSLELRAARDLARLWGEQGRRTEAQNVLSPIFRWFTEGLDTTDLKEAKVLLDQIS